MFAEMAFLIEKQVSMNTINKIIAYDLCNIIKNAT